MSGRERRSTLLDEYRGRLEAIAKLEAELAREQEELRALCDEVRALHGQLKSVFSQRWPPLRVIKD